MSTVRQYQPQARELSDAEREARGELVHRIQQDILDARRRGQVAAWDLARAVYLFHEESGWTALGYEKLKEWLAQPEIGMQERQFFRFVRRYKTLVIRHALDLEDLADLDPTKVDVVLPAIEAHKKDVSEALTDAREMGWRDLREDYRDVVDAPSVDDSPFESEPESGADSQEAPEEAERSKRLNAAANRVDSWLLLAGDRRKAKGAWVKLMEGHPLLVGIRDIEACIHNKPGAPPRKEARELWVNICEVLGLDLEDQS